MGSWDRAARCFQAIALGVSDKSILSLATDRHYPSAQEVAGRSASECGGGWGGGLGGMACLAWGKRAPAGCGSTHAGCSVSSSGSQPVALLASHIRTAPSSRLFSPRAGTQPWTCTASLPAGTTVAAETAQAEAVAEILMEHERVSSAIYTLSVPAPQQGAAQQQQQPNGVAGPQQQQGLGSEEGEDGAPPPDPAGIDWDAPLRPAAREGEDAGTSTQGSTTAGAARAGASSGGGAAVLDAVEARRVVKVAELGLRLAEAAAEAGHQGGCAPERLGGWAAHGSAGDACQPAWMQQPWAWCSSSTNALGAAPAHW